MRKVSEVCIPFILAEVSPSSIHLHQPPPSSRLPKPADPRPSPTFHYPPRTHNPFRQPTPLMRTARALTQTYASDCKPTPVTANLRQQLQTYASAQSTRSPSQVARSQSRSSPRQRSSGARAGAENAGGWEKLAQRVLVRRVPAALLGW